MSFSPWKFLLKGFAVATTCTYAGEKKCHCRDLKRAGCLNNHFFQIFSSFHAFTDVGGMIAHSFEFVGNPEQVGSTLQDEGVMLKGRDGSCSCKHGHQVMTHQVIADIDNIILFPDVACSIDITVRKGLHGPLQDSPRLLAQVKDTAHDGCFCDLSILTPGSGLDRITQASRDRHLSRVAAQGGQTEENLGNPLRAIACALKITCN